MSGLGPATAKYAVVAAGAFLLMVGAGLFAVMRSDERRLAQLEAELQSRQLSPAKVSTSSTDAAPSQPPADAVAVPSLPDPAGDQNSNQLALGAATVVTDVAPPVASQPPPPSPVAPQNTGSQEASPASVEPGPAENASVEPSAAPADGWLHDSQLTSQDIDAPSTPSWFASLNSSESAETAAPVCSADRSLRTALIWAKSPQEAADRARREGKLVFIIHVSGNFEDPGFT